MLLFPTDCGLLYSNEYSSLQFLENKCHIFTNKTVIKVIQEIIKVIRFTDLVTIKKKLSFTLKKFWIEKYYLTFKKEKRCSRSTERDSEILASQQTSFTDQSNSSSSTFLFVIK